MAVFRVEKNSGYTVMSNHHLRNRALSLKAKGLLSQMLSLPEDWDYTLQGLARINRESIDAIRQAIRELEQAGYIQRSRERDEKGRLRGADYVIFELPQPVPASVSPTLENPTLENPTQEKPTLENPMQLNLTCFLLLFFMEQKGWIAVFYLPPVTMWKRLYLLISLVGRCSSIKSYWRLPVRLALLELHCSYLQSVKIRL